MDKLKKLRTPLRTAFTKSANVVEDMFKKAKIDKEELQAAMDSLERKAEQVMELDKDIMQQMVDENNTEEELTNEYEKICEYEGKLFLCRRKVDAILKAICETEESEYGTVVSRTKKTAEKKYKLPKIEFTKFGGNLKDWLAFWAQFQKIHKDNEMAEEDKFHYLRQSTLENSKAREVIDSFPMTAENYQKVVDHLTARFGNKDTLVEVYVRELLKLVLTNALNPLKKMVISSLYYKIETQLRALESLEVTRNEFVAILYPLVESCLPEEILRAWERHRVIPISSSDEKIDRLSHLMLFLKGEVESEERISLARSGFGEQMKKKKDDKINEIPTAAGLWVESTDEKSHKSCIFCNKPHYSNQCLNAKKMTLIERQKICEQQGACFACLAKGHITKDCPNKSKIKCQNCNRQHCQLMCRKNVSDNKVGETAVKTIAKLSVSKTHEVNEPTSTSNLLIKQEETVLSTLLIRIQNGDRVKIVRAAIDSGSHKTYLLKKVIQELDLKKNGQERLFHELFGGHQITDTVHERYEVQAENLNGLYSCTFDVLEQERICYDVKRLPKGQWLNDLKKENIMLSDVGVGSSEIELLIGGNIAGRLLVGIHKLEGYDNFVAMNYSLGWTIMGQIPDNKVRNNMALLVHTLFIREANIADLWRLDLIGIEDPAETRIKEKHLEAASNEFKNNLTINQEGRYEIQLPFIKGCPPIKSNRSMAEQRLFSTTKKLNPDLRIVYQKIFDDWKADGIIEEVPIDELDNFGHYMPHKPVLNPNSLTTPVRPVFDASAKENKSLSLNDCLEKGPNLLEVITSVMVRFRMWKYGVLSYIKKVFLQISIEPKHRDYLRFLWWEKNSSKKMKVFRHRRLVFGLTCSSFILAAIINEILDNAPEQYQDTARQLKHSNYVDNCITSVEDEAAVSKFEKEAKELLLTGQFDLRGWEWNSPMYKDNYKKEISVLGLTWNLAQDTLTCDIDKGSNLGDDPITKRKILSTAHQIFDPIGFTLPLLIYPKTILQDCWEMKISSKVTTGTS